MHVFVQLNARQSDVAAGWQNPFRVENFFGSLLLPEVGEASVEDLELARAHILEKRKLKSLVVYSTDIIKHKVQIPLKPRTIQNINPDPLRQKHYDQFCVVLMITETIVST